MRESSGGWDACTNERIVRTHGVDTPAVARGAKLALERALRASGMPEAAMCEALVAWIEVVKNWHRHTRSADLTWTARIVSRRAHLHEAMRSGNLTIQARYGTRRFDTRPRHPDLYQGSGWGIGLIRGLCDETTWRFEPAPAGSADSPELLRLTLVKRWLASE